jgi:flagellar assembly protein FliH
MSLIKASNLPSNLAPYSMTDIESAARRILLRANYKAEQILTAAQSESENLKKQAKEQGHREGLADGRAAGLAEGCKSGHAEALAKHAPELTKLIEALTAATTQIEREREDLESVGVQSVVELAAAIARRVTKRHAAIDPAVLCSNLREAMGLVVHFADVRIALHPSQRATLETELPNLRQTFPQLKHVELIDDASISLGGARISTVGGHIDADLQTQLDMLINQLLPETAAVKK